MEVLLSRFSSSETSTTGLLYVSGVFACFTLEPPCSQAKPSRIPVGLYKLELKSYGGFHNRYKRRFPGMHEGMLRLVDVPNFTDILIHCGNRTTHTRGCILLGDSISNNQIEEEAFLARSANAYRRVYPTIRRAIGDKYCDLRIVELDSASSWRREEVLL